MVDTDSSRTKQTRASGAPQTRLRRQRPAETFTEPTPNRAEIKQCFVYVDDDDRRHSRTLLILAMLARTLPMSTSDGQPRLCRGDAFATGMRTTTGGDIRLSAAELRQTTERMG